MSSTVKKKSDTPKQEADPGLKLTDPVVLGNVLADVAERARPVLQKFLENYEVEADDILSDPMNIREAYLEFLQHLWANPRKMFEMQMGFWQDWAKLWQESTNRFISGEGKDSIEADKGDRRFQSPLWQESALFGFIKQSYLLTSRWMEHAVRSAEGLDENTKQKLDFYTRQFVNAMAPGNFLLTNPDVLKETLDTHGENLIRGLENLLEDMQRGRISTTDYEAFKVGENLATTKGKVVYQNDLMQLIQYAPTTDKVFRRPLIIVPPWINKFYILDLQPHNSFIKWLVGQGHTVFAVSWVNPDQEMAQKRFEDYMEDGVFDAMKQVRTITGEPDCNMIGYCLGGTLLAITLAWLAAKEKDDLIASVTFLTTLIDFEEAGELKLFIDDDQIAMMEKSMSEKGFLDAAHLRKTFSLLRSNDMIWSFVINNYLMGKEPFPFDLLYWNDDSTNMPAAMHSFYLRKLYRDNLLIVPGGVTMGGVAIDITQVKTPCYLLSTKEDHIAPWKATYAATRLLQGPLTFVLAASGHVAGVINPPDKNKYCYWTGAKTPKDPNEWMENAESHNGSWWPHWQKWAIPYAGDRVPAREPGGGKLEPIEDAPGSYVAMKAD